MKILKIKYCHKCTNYLGTFDRDIQKVRFLCKHPYWKKRKNQGRIINKKSLVKGVIPGWCKLEDYKE